MNKHFCNCPNTVCPHHAQSHDNGCDPCIKKNLELGEIPACFWLNDVTGTTEYSAVNFAKHIMGKRSQI